MSIVDAIMLAYYNAIHLSYQSIGDTPVVFIMLTINGLVQGTLFITSEAFGKKDYETCGNALKQGMKQAFIWSLFFMPFFLFAPQILSNFNYSEENIRISSIVMQILGASLPFVAISIVTQFFLQGIKQAWVSSWFVLIANMLNIMLCWLLIGGKLGFPELGAVGVAISTASVRIFLCFGTLAYIFCKKEYQKFFKKEGQHKVQINKTQRDLGLGATANMLSTESSNLFSVFLISVLNIGVVAAYTLSYRIFIIGTLISVSFAVVCSILISIGIGKKDISTIKSAIFSSLKLNNFLMLIICSLIFLFSPFISTIMTKDPHLASQTTPFLKLVAFMIFFNGIYSILIISLRALRDLLIPSLITFFVFTIYVPAFSLFFVAEPIDVSYILLSANIIVATALTIRLFYLLPRYKF